MANQTRTISHTATSTTSNRDFDLRMIHAFVLHAQANPEADVLEGLSALVGHLQGDADQLDDADRQLVRTLRTNSLENYDSFPARS